MYIPISSNTISALKNTNIGNSDILNTLYDNNDIWYTFLSDEKYKEPTITVWPDATGGGHSHFVNVLCNYDGYVFALTYINTPEEGVDLVTFYFGPNPSNNYQVVIGDYTTNTITTDSFNNRSMILNNKKRINHWDPNIDPSSKIETIVSILDFDKEVSMEKFNIKEYYFEYLPDAKEYDKLRYVHMVKNYEVPTDSDFFNCDEYNLIELNNNCVYILIKPKDESYSKIVVCNKHLGRMDTNFSYPETGIFVTIENGISNNIVDDITGLKIRKGILTDPSNEFLYTLTRDTIAKTHVVTGITTYSNSIGPDIISSSSLILCPDDKIFLPPANSCSRVYDIKTNTIIDLPDFVDTTIHACILAPNGIIYGIGIKEDMYSEEFDKFYPMVNVYGFNLTDGLCFQKEVFDLMNMLSIEDLIEITFDKSVLLPNGTIYFIPIESSNFGRTIKVETHTPMKDPVLLTKSWYNHT